jgi:lysophospholipase L1-like esterase
MGDSFSSGEGVPPFIDGTDISFGNDCHRSRLAYSELLSQDLYHGDVPPSDFVACSGAVMTDVYLSNPSVGWRGPPEAPQIDQLNKKYGPVGLVTITMGGNNIHFPDIIKACLLSVRTGLPGFGIVGSGHCHDALNPQFEKDLAAIDGTDPAHTDSAGTLERMYQDIRKAAGPAARILVAGYPHEFDPSHLGDCSHIDYADLKWANGVSDQVDAVIKRNIDAANARIEYVDVNGPGNLFEGRGLCGPNPAFNAFEAKALGVNHEYSFHPNAAGQELYEESFLRVLRPPPVSSCSSQTFLEVVRNKGYAQSVTPSGTPTCAGGYALETFVPYAGGQQAQFFFKQNPDGAWTIIEGGSAIPTIACRTIPSKILSQLAAQCPSAAMSPPPAAASTAPPSGGCNSAIFLKLMQNQGATVTSASGPPKCLNGYAEQNFNYPKGPTANYPTFFFHSDSHGGWTILGGGAIGGAMSVCSALPASVLAAFQLPTKDDSGCPAG